MKTITLSQVNNYKKEVCPKVVPKCGVRCECGAEIFMSNKYCWWCGGMYNWGHLQKGDGRF